MLNSWNQRFKQKDYVYGTEANEFIKNECYRFKQNSSLAAYAEGEGRNAVHIASLGHKVTAYDYARSGLDKTIALGKLHNLTVDTKLVDLLEDELLCEAYDGALMVYGHFPKNRQYNVLNKIMNSIKAGGIFLLEVYEDKQLAYKTGGPKDVNWLYDSNELLKWAKQFRMLHFFVGETERYEGLLHHGTSYVVQLVIKK
ncbi:methyltransferase [Bacillus coahuilensis m2-6]|uniref:Methyltransferase n=1 Tax=Bacillus coahuilensis p1.1.43 TaxID=1150625 RepID=A0A147K6B7_9BACI|nr:methyltransferase [Bacillus coahuilensis p1.1.43]KUP06236.1 methyltransferase [Bacillus coahuilensis m2-6]